MSKKWNNERIDEALAERDIHRITDVTTIKQPSTTLIQWQCDVCDHTWNSRVDNVIGKQSGCPQCAGNISYTLQSAQQILDGRGDGVKIISIIDGNTKTHRRGKFLCTHCNNTWENNLHNVLSPSKQQGCKVCNRYEGLIGKQWKNNFQSTFYVVLFESDTEQFIKVGITKQPIKSRFGKRVYRGYIYTSLIEYQGTATQVWEWEEKILKKFHKGQYIPSPKNFSGKTECFDVQYKNSILSYYDKLKRGS